MKAIQHKRNFVIDSFAAYYKDHSSNVKTPPCVERREFGFFQFQSAIMIRHKSFEDAEALNSYLKAFTASDVYYSSAYYENPRMNMEEKGWAGADLVFDIDADHITTPCGKIHDSWICRDCGFPGRGSSPERCPSCGDTKFDAKVWTCEVCLESARHETIKLIRMLMDDFGLADDEVGVYFSGNRGYHIHVESESVRSLDSMARKEIVDYVLGIGIQAEFQELVVRSRIAGGSGLSEWGWKRRISKGIDEFLMKSKPKAMEAMGLNKRATNFLTKNNQRLLQGLKKSGLISVKGVGIKGWKKIIHSIADQQSAKIDTVVTTDTHRLIRLPGSLHGKTGLMKIEAPSSDLDSFDPLRRAVAFKSGEVLVDVIEAPEFRIGDAVHGPFKTTSRMELPTAAALFLLCKGAAREVK